MTPRETIYSRVFAFFSALTAGGNPAFKSATRKLDTWEGVAPEDSPALLFSQINELAINRKGMPLIWEATCHLLLYVHTGAQNDPTVVPSQLMNPLLDAIELALKPDDVAMDNCSLGGIVSHCAFSGSITIIEGNMGDEAVAVIPINIRFPATT